MKLLAIDPGPLKSAAVVWDGSAILWSEFEENAVIEEALSLVDFDEVACEHLACMGMAVGKETFETGMWIGEFRQIVKRMDKPFHRVYRNEVKMTLCGNARAKDGNIRQALIDMIGPQGTKKNPGPTYGIAQHLWAALGVAVTCMKNLELRLL